MHPELPQDVIRLERGVGGEKRAPISVGVLEGNEVFGCALEFLLGGGD